MEARLDRLERREQALIARGDLLEGRVSRDGEGGGKGERTGEKGGERERDVLRLKQLRGKKERLGYTVERLELQAQQRERELRRSVAAQ